MVLLPEKEKRKKEGKKVHILKKFIPYYSPYKSRIFSGSDLCGSDQSDRSCLSADPTYYDKNDICRKFFCHIEGVASDRSCHACDVHYSGALQILCQLSGTYDGC